MSTLTSSSYSSIPQSQAAVLAIAALQCRIRELEEEEGTLKLEVEKLKKTVKLKENEFEKRERELEIVFERARNMKQQAENALIEIEQETYANYKLKKDLEKQKMVISNSKKVTNSKKSAKKGMKTQFKDHKKLGDEYEDLLSIIFSPPELIGKIKSKKHATKKSDIDLLPVKVRNICLKLLELPKNFSKQKMCVKNEIIHNLILAREEARRLSDRIYRLENNRLVTLSPQSAANELKTDIKRFNTIVDIMNNFEF